MSAQTSLQTPRSRVGGSVVLMRHIRPLLAAATITLFTLMVLLVFLSPFGYMMTTAFKSRAQITDVNLPLLPVSPAVYSYTLDTPAVYEISFVNVQGNVVSQTVMLQKGTGYPMYRVPVGCETPPFEGCEVRDLALIARRTSVNFFIDPDHPEEGVIEWTGNLLDLKPSYELDLHWENFARAWEELDFPKMIRNTVIIAVTGVIGTTLSCILVAYGFSRFRIPGKAILFLILIGTIILPSQVTLIPTYTVFKIYIINKLQAAFKNSATWGWIAKYAPLLPLTLPHFFANAYNVFLLRQYFLTIPKEMDEAAMIDGASPFRTLVSVILPQALPAVTAVMLFHFMWAWNDYFGPLIYLAGVKELQPLSIGIQLYNQQYSFMTFMVQATALMGLVLPVVIFFLAQRVFMQGVVVTGVEK